MSFESAVEIKVGLRFDRETVPVGRLAMRDRQIYFEFDPSFIERGLEISPFRCPLKPGLRTFEHRPFEGLPGVFSDSLPDGWGRLLLDRRARAAGILPERISPLDRLAHVGDSGMGALVYEPDRASELEDRAISLDELAQNTELVLEGEASEILDEMFALNGSSGGARPKAVLAVHPDSNEVMSGYRQLPTGHQHWMVKFGSSSDGPDAGAIEYVYSLMARKAGVEMEETRLFPARRGAGYFATRRFDRSQVRGRTTRTHFHTVSGLLHVDFRLPSLDYRDLLKLTMALTRDIREVERMFRLAAFNVLAHNRDDHAKNFSFLMDSEGEWRLAPGYDLTFSSGPGGEQSCTVMGEGRNPTDDDLARLGLDAKLPKTAIEGIIERTRDALSGWRALAREHGVSEASIREIGGRIGA